MKKFFSCNFTSELEELLVEKKVDVDYVKFVAIDANLRWIDRAIKFKPILFHGFPPDEGSICKSDFIETFALDAYLQNVKLTKTQHISGHIAATEKHYPHYNIDKESKSKNEILNNTIKNINFLKQNINLPLALENTPYDTNADRLRLVADGDFITKILKETDSHFLFDVSHARTTSYYEGIEFSDYIKTLPLDRLYEVHLNGTVFVPGVGLTAPHTKMNQEDYDILTFLIRNTPIKYVTLEYGPMDSSFDNVNKQYKEELYEQITRLQEILYKMA